MARCEQQLSAALDHLQNGVVVGSSLQHRRSDLAITLAIPALGPRLVEHLDPPGVQQIPSDKLEPWSERVGCGESVISTEDIERLTRIREHGL